MVFPMCGYVYQKFVWLCLSVFYDFFCLLWHTEGSLLQNVSEVTKLLLVLPALLIVLSQVVSAGYASMEGEEGLRQLKETNEL